MPTHHDHWQEIFTQLNIISEVNNSWFFDLTATSIKELTGKEARLMAKVDFEKSLPDIMKDNNLSILAIKNGTYRIAKTNPFIVVPRIKNKENYIKMPSGYITLDPFDINSESWALDIAHVSWILKQVFTEDVELTIRWRLRKWANFMFHLESVDYPVNWVQIEVDGGYEWATTVNLIEAKIGTLSTISIRQLLYPELAWRQTLNDRKKVRSFLFAYEEPFFRFIPFIAVWDTYTLDIDNEKVFKFIWGKDYDIMSISVSSTPDMDFTAPLPQADDFDKVLIMLRKIASSGWEISREDLIIEMLEHGLEAERQFNYYHSCLKLLKLSPQLEKWVVKLTKRWTEIAKLTSKEQAFEIAKILFSEETFHKALHEWTEAIPNIWFVEKWQISWSTIHRRKLTIKSWISWFNSMFTEK